MVRVSLVFAINMRLQAALAVLALLVVVRSLPASTLPTMGALVGEEQQLDSAPTRLALLFNANISAACVGRCSLRALVHSCRGDDGGSGDETGGGSDDGLAGVSAVGLVAFQHESSLSLSVWPRRIRTALR